MEIEQWQSKYAALKVECEAEKRKNVELETNRRSSIQLLSNSMLQKLLDAEEEFEMEIEKQKKQLADLEHLLKKQQITSENIEISRRHSTATVTKTLNEKMLAQEDEWKRERDEFEKEREQLITKIEELMQQNQESETYRRASIHALSNTNMSKLLEIEDDFNQEISFVYYHY